MGLTGPVTQTQNVKQEGDRHQDLVPLHSEFVASSPCHVVEQAVQTTPMPQSLLITLILIQIRAHILFVKLIQTCAELRLSTTPWFLPLQVCLK